MFFSRDDKEKKSTLPLLPLRDIVLFPHMVVPLFVGREKSIAALNAARAKKNGRVPPEVQQQVAAIEDPSRLSDIIAAQLSLKLADKQTLLELDSPVKRLEKIYELMQGEIEILKVEKKLKSRVKKQMEKNQKEYY